MSVPLYFFIDISDKKTNIVRFKKNVLMEFYTPIAIKPPAFVFSYTNKTMLLGSCFTEYMGERLAANKLFVEINPFGILYNPASIALSLRKLMLPEGYGENDLFQHEGIYHSFEHHSRFSSRSESMCLKIINERLNYSSEYLLHADRLIITFGTAYVYKLKSDGRIVSNCHKQPEKMFLRERLTVEEIVADWKSLLLSLWTRNPALRVLCTVSPIRHWKDGAHANQLSKAILLLAIDRLITEFPDRLAYFPAYEIMMDELRDYRFYAEDMIHPSSQAIDYIWKRFTEGYFTKETLAIFKEWDEIRKAIDHRPFQPDSKGYKQFITQTLLKLERLNENFPYFDLAKEKEQLESKLI